MGRRGSTVTFFRLDIIVYCRMSRKFRELLIVTIEIEDEVDKLVYSSKKFIFEVEISVWKTPTFFIQNVKLNTWFIFSNWAKKYPYYIGIGNFVATIRISTFVWKIRFVYWNEVSSVGNSTQIKYWNPFWRKNPYSFQKLQMSLLI